MTNFKLLPILVACLLMLGTLAFTTSSNTATANESTFLNSMRVVESAGTTWYYDVSTPELVNRNTFHFYLGQKGDDMPWIRFRHQYYGDLDLDLQNVEVRTETGSYMIFPDGNVSSNSEDGFIWNWFDRGVDADLITMAMDVQTSPIVLLRQNGSEIYFERAMSDTERFAITNVLGAYQELGGTWK